MEWWDSFVQFLTDYDAGTIAELVRDIDWKNVIRYPLTWFAGIPLLVLLVLRKHYGFLRLVISVVLFVALLQNVLPPAGQGMPLQKLLQFLGGAVVLVGFNLYFLFVRQN